MIIEFKTNKKASVANGLLAFKIPNSLLRIEDSDDRYNWYRKLFNIENALCFSFVRDETSMTGVSEVIVLLDKDKNEVDKNTKTMFMDETSLIFTCPVFFLDSLPLSFITNLNIKNMIKEFEKMQNKNTTIN